VSRTISARIPTQLHEELRERCNLLGESINDFVKAAIEFGLHSSVDFDFGWSNSSVDELNLDKHNIIDKPKPKVTLEI